MSLDLYSECRVLFSGAQDEDVAYIPVVSNPLSPMHPNILFLRICSTLVIVQCNGRLPWKTLFAGELKPKSIKDVGRQWRRQTTLGIFSHTGHVRTELLAGRQVLRDTWLTLRTSDMIVKFVIGTANLPMDHLKALEKEQKEYNDLLFLPDLEDGFLALTQKLIDMFVWLDHNVSYKFVLKVDDDSFVRLDALAKELPQKSQEKLFWGFFDGRARVHKAGKYAEADWVLCDRYLPYAKGGGYVLSADLVHFVSLNASTSRNTTARTYRSDLGWRQWKLIVNTTHASTPNICRGAAQTRI